MNKLSYYFKQIKAEINFFPQNIKYSLTSKKRAVYIGCTDKDNLGDEAVFFGIRALLKKKIYLYKISYAFPTSGKYFRKLFFKAPDFIILGGGTIILKDKEQSYLRLFSQYHNQYPKAKLVVFGAGVADTDLAEKNGNPTNISHWQEVLNKCSFIAVRGVLSRSRLKDEWRINPDVHVLHDPSIQFLRDKIVSKTSEKKIGINFCNILGQIYGLNQAQLELFAKELVRGLLAANWEITCIPTTKDDILFMQRLFEEDDLKDKLTFKEYIDINCTLQFIEDVDVFVGQRLHSIIFSSLVGTPFLAIEYESKTSDFVNTIGIKDCIMRTDKLSVKKALTKIEDLYHSQENHQKTLVKLLNQVKKEQFEVTNVFLNEVNF